MLLEGGGERFGWEVNLNVGVCEGDEPVCKKGGGSSATYDFEGRLASSVSFIENIYLHNIIMIGRSTAH